MMIAPIDRTPFIKKPGPNYDTVDRALHGMLDTDGNGKVSKDEWTKSGRTEDAFKMFDADADGSISEHEFVQTRRYEREFNAKDRNGSGFLTRLELQGLKYFGTMGGGLLKATEKAEATLAEGKDLALRCLPPFIRDRFAGFDADRDGKVSKEEYVAGRRKEETRIIPFNPWISKFEGVKLAANDK